MVHGSYPEGTAVHFECELGYGNRIVNHPSVCQANGTWTQAARCEGDLLLIKTDVESLLKNHVENFRMSRFVIHVENYVESISNNFTVLSVCSKLQGVLTISSHVEIHVKIFILTMMQTKLKNVLNYRKTHRYIQFCSQNLHNFLI